MIDEIASDQSILSTQIVLVAKISIFHLDHSLVTFTHLSEKPLNQITPLSTILSSRQSVYK